MITLYQLDSKGNIKQWSIEVIKSSDYSEIIVKTGRLDSSNLIVNVSRIVSGKNIGKSNETTHYTQAKAEAKAKIELQLRKGYVYNLEDVKSSSVLGSGIPAPMLANKYCKDGSQKGSKTLKQLKLEGKNIIVQPKLDGNRCLIKIENGKAVMYTRQGDVMPVQLSHILDEVDCSENCILDGELFSDEISFNTLNGLIKRVTVTDEDIEKRKLIKYHLYDVMLDKGYEIRSEYIKKFKSENIFIVPSINTIASDYSIQTFLELFLEQGYEGLMIRQLGIGYEHKRTWQLCKVKIFEDEEFKLVGFEEDVRGGFVGAFIMKDEKNNIFKAGASGQSVEERKEMWNNKEKYIGKMATVMFFGKSEYGIPRFPKYKGER